MGEFKDKMKGAANKAIGMAKVTLGENTDNAALIAKGHVQEAKGKAQNTLGTVKGKLGNRF
jgi:uncharacterized protein YjbJ (UPF0337 family)